LASDQAVPATVDDLQRLLRDHLYMADRGLALSIFLSLKLQRPLFLEGEAGVGKTEVSKVLSEALGTSLIRLQCYEGLDINHAVYEWNYARQLLQIRLMEASGSVGGETAPPQLFGEEFLIRRPLLQALDAGWERPPVLLIDEIDRADAEFEAFLLEILSDFQVSVPELGTLTANHMPIVVLTSNNTRELSEALKRRCLYLFIGYPSLEQELTVVRLKVPDLAPQLARQAVELVQSLRQMDLRKLPSISETLDWAQALVTLNTENLDQKTLETTLSVLLKHETDMRKVQRQLSRMGDNDEDEVDWDDELRRPRRSLGNGGQ
jgi:MoxR-like ATPase